MSEALDLDRAPEKMKEPAKRWRAKRQAGSLQTNGLCLGCKAMTEKKRPGEIYWAHCAHPSREIVEQKNTELVEGNIARGFTLSQIPKLLGIYPEPAP